MSVCAIVASMNRHQLFDMTEYDAQVPDSSPIKLNTSSFKLFLPQVRRTVVVVFVVILVCVYVFCCVFNVIIAFLLLYQLYKKFPDMGMVLNLSAPKPPNMDITSKSINLTVPCDVDVSVIDTASKTTKPAFTIRMVKIVVKLSLQLFFR